MIKSVCLSGWLDGWARWKRAAESKCFLIQESGDAEEELPLPDVQLEEH